MRGFKYLLIAAFALLLVSAVPAAPAAHAQVTFGVSHGTGHREIGYLLRRDAWGQGIATELVNALVQWHPRHPDPTMSATLHGYVFRTNTASRHILSHAAFRPAGHDPHDPRQLLYVRDVAAGADGCSGVARGGVRGIPRLLPRAGDREAPSIGPRAAASERGAVGVEPDRAAEPLALDGAQMVGLGVLGREPG